MKHFAIAAVMAAIFGLSTARTADAQYIIQYSGFTPNGGLATTSQLYGLGGYQSYNTYLSPFGTYRQTYYGNSFGNMYGAATGYNPYFGFGYSRGFYQPNMFFNPYGGYRYNFYRRW